MFPLGMPVAPLGTALPFAISRAAGLPLSPLGGVTTAGLASAVVGVGSTPTDAAPSARGALFACAAATIAGAPFLVWLASGRGCRLRRPRHNGAASPPHG